MPRRIDVESANPEPLASGATEQPGPPASGTTEQSETTASATAQQPETSASATAQQSETPASATAHQPETPGSGTSDNLEPEIRRVELCELSNVPGSATRRLTVLSEVTVPLTVELGQTTMRVRDLLTVGPGSVIELDRDAKSPVDVRAGGQVIARGEVVVIGDMFGVRVTELVGSKEKENAENEGPQG
jgi:flagellar motor switch protein FliN/FliY